MAKPCCERDRDGDGNCDRHPAPHRNEAMDTRELWEIAGLEEPWGFARTRMAAWFARDGERIAADSARTLGMSEDRFVVEEHERRTGRTTRRLLAAIPKLRALERKPGGAVVLVVPSEGHGENMRHALRDLWFRIHGRQLGVEIRIRSPGAKMGGRPDLEIIDHSCAVFGMPDR